jgi:hypothetical protein
MISLRQPQELLRESIQPTLQFSENVSLLWAQGNAEAAIRMEQLGNEVALTHDIDILCAYPLGSLQGGVDTHIFQQICAEHSAVFS